MTTQELREKAAQLLEKRGWCQNEKEDHLGRLCLYGALCAAAGARSACYDESVQEAMDQLSDEVYAGSPNPRSAITWNDYCSRTKQEVINALRGVKCQ